MEIKSENSNWVDCFDNDLGWLNNFWLGDGGESEKMEIKVSDENKADIATMIYSDNSKGDSDCVYVRNFFRSIVLKISLMQTFTLRLCNINERLSSLEPLKWWQFWKFIQRFFINKEKEQTEEELNINRKGYTRVHYDNLKCAVENIDKYLSENKNNNPENLPEEQRQNEINTTNNNKINPISKVVNENENMEMTDEDYIGYLNRINGKGQENRKQNIDDRNND